MNDKAQKSIAVQSWGVAGELIKRCTTELPDDSKVEIHVVSEEETQFIFVLPMKQFRTLQT